jgi:hypothetical protein
MNNKKLNYTKLNTLLKIIEYGELPRDRWGQILSCRDLIAWYGFNESLDQQELRYMETKLSELVETQNAIELMKLPRL